MKCLRQRVLGGEFLAGTWCNLGSSLTAEIAGLAGFDWVLLDLEHGAGDHSELLPQLQAVGATPAAPVVRVAWNDPVRFKRVLDLGAAGVMVPFVNTADEALLAVQAMRYPPQGVRGMARLTRAAGFGWEFDDYARRANAELLTVVQIETAQAVGNAAAIAAVDGADVLFVGPTDLSTNLGVPPSWNEAAFRDALQQVVSACRHAGKAAGILLSAPAQIEQAVADGFRFIALGSDGAVVAAGMKAAAEALARHKGQ